MDIKKCALIRQTWYEAARKRMKDGARLAFYEACFDYEFYGKTPDDEQQLFAHDDALLLFEVVRSDLERDREKAETIAMRNRRNGMLGGRPRKDSGDLSKSTNPQEPSENPENPNGYFGVSTTITNTNTSTSKDKSFSVASRKKRHKDIDRYDYFRVMFVFFYSGAIDPAAETEKFYNYYQARDWKIGRNQAVKDKVALAKTWDIKDCNPGLISARKMYSDLIEYIDPEEVELLTDFMAMIKDDTRKQIIIRMQHGQRINAILEEHYLQALTMFFYRQLKADGYTLTYEAMQA